MRMFFSVFVPLFFSGFVAAPSVWADLEEWNLEDSVGGSISVAYTYVASDSAQNSISVTLPFIQYSQLHAYYGEYTQNMDGGDSFSSQDIRIGVSTDPYAAVSFDVSYDKFGKNSAIIYENTSLALDVDVSSNIEVVVRGLVGDIELNPGTFSEETQALLENFGLLSDERVGGGLELRYHLENWQWSLAYNAYDYKGFPSLTAEQRQQLEDSIRLDSYRFALYLWLLGLDSNTTERYRREFILSTLGAYRDATRSKSILVEQDAALSAQWYTNTFVYQFTLMVYESYIEESFHRQLSVGANYQINESFGAGLRMIYADETSQLFSELSLGYRW